MDSLTQLTLGAAVGHAVAGRQGGRKALVWGAICGTLPDLDVFVPLGNAVADFTYHRSASHSLVMLALLTPLLVWLIRRLHPDRRVSAGRWTALVYLVFATHVLLDAFTVYGTQIFWPLFTTPVAWATIFIIDPAYTLPLALGVLAALTGGRDSARGHRWNTAGLALSTVYLAWTLGAKTYVDRLAHEELERQGVRATSVLTLASPFNSVLWRMVAVDREYYYEAFYSLLDDDRAWQLVRYPRNLDLVEPINGIWPVRRLLWFSKDFVGVRLQGNSVVMNDLRMGLEPDYVFRFKVAEKRGDSITPVPVQRIEEERDMSRLPVVWERIFDPAVRL